VKQGSGSAHPHQQRVTDATRAITASSLHGYDDMLRAKVAPEEARIVLPLNTMTTVTWTGSLLFWSRVCNQRVDSHAQLAAQELSKKIADIVRPYYPVSWAALCGE
jgi:thymidylate synthase ThyX